MTEPLVIVGCGGHGRDVREVVDAINLAAAASQAGLVWNLLGHLDDAPSDVDRARVEAAGALVLGPVASADAAWKAFYVVGVGSGSVRQRLAKQLDDLGFRPAVLVHPTATVGRADLGGGSVVCAGARLTADVDLGRHVHVNLNATVAHDCTLEDFSTLNPQVALSGNCRVGARATLGTHSTVLQGLTIGADAVVGAGACVVRDVPPAVTVKGVPAR